LSKRAPARTSATRCGTTDRDRHRGRHRRSLCGGRRGGRHRTGLAAGGGLTGHGFKDLWQHRRQYVANTRWWPPFCLVVDWVVAVILVVLIAVGVDFHH
jgi:hypothetical protein